MKSAFEQFIGRKRKRVVSADELPSPRQPRVTIESPTRSTLQPLTVETVSSSPIQSASESHRTPNPDPSAAPTSQPSLRERLFPKGETYGLRVLYEPAEPLVDIIFVHGLTGDSYNTWLEADSGTYWPVHLLSKDVPDARIMTFGYDADVTKFLGPVSQNNLHDHAAALLGELAAVRLDDDNDRKIVFVVHSLGGLVTKKALCLSEWAFEPHLKQMDRCTIAVAFLGTPHRGSNLTPFASSVANILNAGGKRVNKQILQLLGRNSEVLADVEESYGVWLRRNSSRFSLTCFFEELELPAVGMVVAKESAKISGYPQLSIHANHMGMTRYSSATNAGYMRIRGEVKRWLSQLETSPETTITLTQDEQGCLRSLAFPEMNDRGNDIVPPADGTCTWLREHPVYTDWISQRRGLLWIKGKPGAGKSTLLKYGLLTLPTIEPPLRIPLTISFFFHGRGAEIQKTPLGLYRSLLYQLLEKFPKALSHVVQTFKSNCAGKGMPGEKWKWHVQELRDFIESSLTKILEESAIRIFVDALDECGEGEARRLVRNFNHLSSICSSAPHGLSICFSCRHWPVIAPDQCQEICAEHENHEDIRTYIQEELQSVVHDPEERETLQDEIEARSEWVFQWVALVMPRIVGMCRDGKTLRQCLEVLKEIPQDLDDLYEIIIHSLKRSDQDQSMKLFQWICFARGPLSIAELRCAMNVDANPAYQSFQDCKKLPGYIETDTQMEKQLQSLSGGLAEWKNHKDERVAQLVHQSVNDYLISKGFYRFDISLDSIDKVVGCSHTRLSRSCIVYFAMDEIKRRQHHLEIESRAFQNSAAYVRSWEVHTKRSLRKVYSLFQYASESWLPHAQVAEEHGMPQDDILQYLQRHPAWTMCLRLDVIANGSDPIKRDETLLYAVSSYNLTSLVSVILNSCERYNVDINSKDGFLLQTPLCSAARSGYEGVVKLLLAQPDVDVNSKDRYGQTPLSRAAENGHEGMIKLLLAQSNVDANSKDEYGQTPLTYAAKRGHEAVVKLLLAQPDVDVNPKNKHGQTPLSQAAENEHEGVVKLLLAQSNVDANSKDKYGQTPLSYAARRGHEGVIKLLLAQPNVAAESKNKWAQTLLSLVAENGHEAAIKLLRSQPKESAESKNRWDQTLVSLAAIGGHASVIKLLAANPDIDVTSRDELGVTLLILAAKIALRHVGRELRSRCAPPSP